MNRAKNRQLTTRQLDVDSLGQAVHKHVMEVYLKLDDLEDTISGRLRQTRIEELKQNATKTRQQIEASFDQLIGALNERRTELLGELDAIESLKSKEIADQSGRDVQIRSQLVAYKTKLRGTLANRDTSMEQKRAKIEGFMRDFSRRKDLIPAIDDITLSMVSLRWADGAIRREIQNIGKIDNEDEKQMENLGRYWKFQNGTLTVILNGARDLPGADKSGLSDPFCEVSVPHNKQRKSKVVKQNNNPCWNETFVFQVRDAVHDKVVFRVFDKDTFGKNDKLGDLVYPVINVLKAPGGFLEKNLMLQNASSGSLLVCLEYVEQ